MIIVPRADIGVPAPGTRPLLQGSLRFLLTLEPRPGATTRYAADRVGGDPVHLGQFAARDLSGLTSSANCHHVLGSEDRVPRSLAPRVGAVGNPIKKVGSTVTPRHVGPPARSDQEPGTLTRRPAHPVYQGRQT